MPFTSKYIIKGHKSKLNNNLAAIYLDAKALDQETGYTTIQYDFSSM